MRRLGLLVLRACGTVLAVYLFIQLVPRWLPEDPARIAAGEWATEADVQVLRQRMGLDGPWHRALATRTQDLLHGDLGTSLRYRRPVTQLLGESLPVTVTLAALAMVASGLLGWLLALGRGRAMSVVRLLCLAAPVYVTGPLLLWAIASRVSWIPVAGLEGPLSWLLPVGSLALPLAGHQARLLRVALEDLRDAVGPRWWRASGVPACRLWRQWELPAVAAPWLTVVGLQFGGLLGGAVLTETIFALPGTGRLLVTALSARDLPVVQGAVLLGALLYVTAQLTVEALQRLLDPRQRT